MTDEKPSPVPTVRAEPKAVVHSAWTTPDGLTPCCSADPREVGALTLEADDVTCKGTEQK
jgi:hypothetical protein